MLCLFTFTTYRFNLLPVRLALLVLVYGNVKLLVVVQVHVGRDRVKGTVWHAGKVLLPADT